MEETPNPKINLIVSTETSIKQKQMGLVEVPKITGAPVCNALNHIIKFKWKNLRAP